LIKTRCWCRDEGAVCWLFLHFRFRFGAWAKGRRKERLGLASPAAARMNCQE
jgi:hypothetical protein